MQIKQALQGMNVGDEFGLDELVEAMRIPKSPDRRGLRMQQPRQRVAMILTEWVNHRFVVRAQLNQQTTILYRLVKSVDDWHG